MTNTINNSLEAFIEYANSVCKERFENWGGDQFLTLNVINGILWAFEEAGFNICPDDWKREEFNQKREKFIKLNPQSNAFKELYMVHQKLIGGLERAAEILKEKQTPIPPKVEELIKNKAYETGFKNSEFYISSTKNI